MRIVFTSIISLITSVCFGQYYTSSHTSIHFQNRSWGFITELPLAPPGLKGQWYVHDELAKADIFLMDSTALRSVDVKLDVKDNRIEIAHAGQIKVLPFKKVMRVTLFKDGREEHYLSGQVLNFPDPRYEGIFSIVEEGNTMLVATYETDIISADYNAALDVGRKDHEVVMKKRYFLRTKTQWIEVGSNKKAFAEKIESALGTKAAKLLKAVNIRKEKDLIEFLHEINKASS